eukprot:gnl/TRDRNA2_/TRDRNA2_189770_c0_seq1.p1 gnl/TRDRNA2_/TRDRNA2_189770_c0~~gnl/TRDRNA2_/TRDRNA2_189770_c0_seq1.p1  ORF type:complete len:576 (-),score=83.97 gnl/TRDRNA2_/TRDRNA2_189770_c0_seq1:314-1981(-)
MVAADGRLDRDRLRVDPEYLANVFCEKFRKVDTYHRGLITAKAFSATLHELGLKYGQPEVEEILQYCTVTDDGYVHYKDLLRSVQPGTPRAKQSTAGAAIFPSDKDMWPKQSQSQRSPDSPGTMTSDDLDNPLARRDLLAEKTDEIRQVYARWDRGLSTNNQFKEDLKAMGIPLTTELDRLLGVYGPSRNLPFGKLMYALQSDENDGRRSRVEMVHVPGDVTPISTCGSGYQESRGNPVTWNDGASSAKSLGVGMGVGSVHKVVCDFLDGRIPAITVRHQLRRHGVVVNAELDRLIRRHESDNSVKFQEFARAMLRQQEARAEEMAAQNRNITPVSPSGMWGGNESRSINDAASEISSTTGRETLANDENGRSMPSRAAMKTPYATSEDSYKEFGEECSSSRRALQSKNRAPWATTQEDHASLSKRNGDPYQRGGNNGDIIGWHSNDERQQPGRRQRAGGYADPEVSEHLIWHSASEQGSHTPVRVGGKRRPLQSQSQVPFGTSADVGLRCDEGPPATFSKPFGTDTDLRLRRPEDAGTNEYRPAAFNSGPRRAF